MRDPGLRLRRRQRRARWGVAMRAVPTAVIGGLAVQAIVTGDPIAGACLAAVSAGGAWVTAMASRHAWDLHRLRSRAPTGPAAARLGRPCRRGSTRRRAGRARTAARTARRVRRLHRAGRRGMRPTRCASAQRAWSPSKRHQRGRVGLERRADPAVAALVTRLDAGVAAHGQLVGRPLMPWLRAPGYQTPGPWSASRTRPIVCAAWRWGSPSSIPAPIASGVRSLTGERGDQIGRGGVGSVSPATTRAADADRAAEPCTAVMRSRTSATAMASISAAARAIRRRSSSPCRTIQSRCFPSAATKLADPLPARRHGLDDGRPPRARHRVPAAERLHVAQVPHDLVGTVPVGLVDDEDVARSPGCRPWPPGCRRPCPGASSTRVVSASDAISTSAWPTPTVSTMITSQPAASSTRSACGAAPDRPPRWPRDAMERMNTPASVA